METYFYTSKVKVPAAHVMDVIHPESSKKTPKGRPKGIQGSASAQLAGQKMAELFVSFCLSEVRIEPLSRLEVGVYACILSNVTTSSKGQYGHMP